MPGFAEQLNRVRRERHITQEQLAHEINVSRQTISHWENGRAIPDIDTICRLSHALNYNFLAEEEVPAPEPVFAPEEAAVPTEAPVAAKKRRRLWAMPVLALALIILAGVSAALLLKKPAPPVSTAEPYTLEWFQQEQTPVDGQAFLLIQTDENPMRLRYHDQMDGKLGWMFHFRIMERNGISFTVTGGATYFFNIDGGVSVFPAAQDDILDIFDGDTVQQGGVYFWGAGLPAQSTKGVGITVTGVDANGNELTFHGYVELSQEIVE